MIPPVNIPHDANFASVVSLWRMIGVPLSTTFVQDCAAGTAINSLNGCILVNASVSAPSSDGPFANTTCARIVSSAQIATGSGTGSGTYTFGTSDYTVELWARWTLITGDQTLFDMRPASTNGNYLVLHKDTTTIGFYFNSGERINGGTIAVDTWYHIALCRVSGTTRLFIDGTQVGSDYTDSNSYLSDSTTAYRIGLSSFGTGQMSGYLGPGRITKGVGRYSANFTRPGWIFPLHI